MPVPRINFAQYINPGNPSPIMDITGAYRQWQQQHLNERQQAAQESQFAQNQARQTDEFGQEMGYKNRVSDDINARFGLELGEKTNTRGYQQEQGRYQKQLELLNKARNSASQGRWNEVEAMLGSLKELGANVGRELDLNGKPIYHLEAGQSPGASGETFESAIGKLNQNRDQQAPYQFDPSQPQISVPGRNQFDTNLGTIGQSFQPQTQNQLQLSPEHSLTSQEDIAPQGGQTSESFDPYAINSAQLNEMNQSRLQPLMRGIEGAFPNRFQPQIQSLTGGIEALGTSPEGALEYLQKPMDTAARLMGAELNAEGQMARAGMTMSGKEDTQSRLLANDGRAAAQRVLKEYGIKDAVDNSLNMDKVRTLILSGNRNANAQGVKELIKMVEGSRITDKDFDIAATGYASDWVQATERLSRVYRDGLTPDQKSNFNHMIDMYQVSNKFRIGTAAKKLKTYIGKFRSEPERYGAYNEILGNIPDDYLPEELKDWDPTHSFGGEREKPGRQQSKSVNVTAPTTGQAVQGVRDLNSEADEFLSE